MTKTPVKFQNEWIVGGVSTQGKHYLKTLIVIWPENHQDNTSVRFIPHAPHFYRVILGITGGLHFYLFLL